MKNDFLLSLAAVVACCASGLPSSALTLSDIQVRDPYIYADSTSNTYYLYRWLWVSPEQPRGTVEVYTSSDLENWDGPTTVLELAEDNWGTGSIWAPELHFYKGEPYLFATVNCPVEWKQDAQGTGYTMRGTQIFHGQSPKGPFHEFPEKMPATPYGQMCLDGTLWVQDSIPYMVYCHEWMETGDGEICLQQLSNDLRHPLGQPMRLFCGSASKWSDGLIPGVTQEGGEKKYVTDGPFLYRSPKSGNLFMIWSSFSKGEYAMGYAVSTTGRITGPWQQADEPLFSRDGGHGMIFTDFQGVPHIALHSPNGPFGAERPHIYRLIDNGTSRLSVSE